MAPPWVAPPTDRVDKSDESKNPPTGVKSNIRDNRPLSFRGILYNLRGLKKNLCDQAFRDEFVDGGTNGYDIVGWAEPQRACVYAVEGYTVHHSPRCLTGFSKKKGIFNSFTRASIEFRPDSDDVPPETVSILFTNGGIFGQAAEVVLVGSNISNDPKVYGKYINTLGCTLL